MLENIKPILAVSREQAPAKKILDMTRGTTIFNAQNSSFNSVSQIRIHEYTVQIFAGTTTRCERRLQNVFSHLTIFDFDAPSRSEDVKAANYSERFKAQSLDEELKR
uniref:Uncharacterized protein n=1 Tax=Glossina austeni TaxID=7395 RepID=A0A1A9USF4_GLOAU